MCLVLMNKRSSARLARCRVHRERYSLSKLPRHGDSSLMGKRNNVSRLLAFVAGVIWHNKADGRVLIFVIEFVG